MARDESQLSFEPGSIITGVRRGESKGWSVGTLEGKRGYVPADYVVILRDYSKTGVYIVKESDYFA